MKHYLVTFRSVTLAQRGERILQQGGVHAYITRAPRWMEDQGCGYCLRLRALELQKGLDLLQNAGLPYRKLYGQKMDGSWEEQK